jgi:hypothetical protein
MHEKTIVTPSLAIIFPGFPVIGGARSSLTALIGYLSNLTHAWHYMPEPETLIDPLLRILQAENQKNMDSTDELLCLRTDWIAWL